MTPNDMPRLTDAFLEFLTTDGRDRLIFDERQPGFAVRITPTGTKIFVAQGRVAGRRRRETVGFYPKMSLAKAREEALQMLADMRRGNDPAVARKARLKAAQAGEMTISELGDKWLTEYVRPKLKPRTVFDYERLIEQHIKPALGHLTVAHVEHDDINRFHVAMQRTPRQANYAVATVRALLNFAAKLKLRPAASNPARGIKMYFEREVERFLTEEEIGRAADGIEQAEREGKITPHGAAGLRLALLTGARSGEVTAVEWSHVHLDLKLIRIPDSADLPGRKTGARTIQLSDAAIEVIRTIPRVGKFVIAGALPDEPYQSLSRAWTKARAYVELDDVRLHDLRHSYASLAARRGVTLLTIGKLLGHRDAKTTQRYAHLCQDVVASVNDDLGAVMTAAIEKGRARKPTNVVRLKTR
jgi:integrase